MAETRTLLEDNFGSIPLAEDEFGSVPLENQFDFQVEEENEFGSISLDAPDPPNPDVIDFTINKSFAAAGDEQLDQIAFTSDVMSMPLDPADPSDIEPGFVAEEPDPIKFVEALKTKAGRPHELLPFVGSLYKIERIGKVITATVRIQNNPEPPKRGFFEEPEALATRQVEWMRDRYIVAEWLAELEERQTRGLSIGGRIAEGILELPSFMIEFLVTGGVFEGAKQGTKRTIARLLQRTGEKFGAEFVEKVSTQTGIRLISTTAGVLAGTAARTAAQFTRVLESSFQRARPGIKVTEKGGLIFTEAQDTPFIAFAKGFGDVFIENLSEISGPAIGKVGKKIASKFPLLQKFSDGLQKLWLGKNPSKTVTDFNKAMTKVGYNGFLEEIGEEQLGKLLRTATGVTDFPERQDGESAGDFFVRMATTFGTDLLVEAGTLAIPAGVSIAGKAVAGRQAPTEAVTGEVEIDKINLGELREFKKEAIQDQVDIFDRSNVKPVDRVSEEAEQETSTRVALVKNMSKEAQKIVGEKSVAKVKERISFKKPKVKIRQKFKDLLFKTDKAFRDEFAGLRKVVEAADAGELKPADDPVQLAVAFTQKSSAKTRGFVLESTTDLAGNRKSKGLKQIFAPIIKDGGKERFEDFVTYLVAARDLNLQKQNKETGIDPVAAQLTFDALDSPEFAQAAKEVTEWNQKGIDLLVESGRITRESGDAIKLSNPIYVPFFREFTTEEAVITGKGKKFVPKKLKGSKRKIIDPIEGMIQQMDAVIQSAQRAAIERSIANLAERNPEALEDFIKPTRAITPTKFTVEEIKDQLEEIGIDFTGVDDADLTELLTVFRPQAIPLQAGVIKLRLTAKTKSSKLKKNY